MKTECKLVRLREGIEKLLLLKGRVVFIVKDSSFKEELKHIITIVKPAKTIMDFVCRNHFDKKSSKYLCRKLENCIATENTLMSCELCAYNKYSYCDLIAHHNTVLTNAHIIFVENNATALELARKTPLDGCFSIEKTTAKFGKYINIRIVDNRIIEINQMSSPKSIMS